MDGGHRFFFVLFFMGTADGWMGDGGMTDGWRGKRTTIHVADMVDGVLHKAAVTSGGF